MTYTSHGHLIPGSPVDAESPEKIFRCGGPGLCAVCTRESGEWTESNLIQGAIARVMNSGLAEHEPVIEAHRYQSKIVDIVAIEFTGGAANGHDIVNWIIRNGGNATWEDGSPPWTSEDGTESHGGWSENLKIETDAGWVEAQVGDFIIQGTDGEFYPCPPGRFHAKYEPKE